MGELADADARSTLWAESLVSRTTGEPRVNLVHNERQIAQLSVAEARAWALNILGAAEAAETDAFLHHYLIDQVGLETPEVLALLTAFRRYRDKHAGAEPM